MRRAFRVTAVVLCIGLLSGCSTLTSLWDRVVGSPTATMEDRGTRTIPAVTAGSPSAAPAITARSDGATAAPIRAPLPSTREAEPPAAMPIGLTPPQVGVVDTPRSVTSSEAAPSAERTAGTPVERSVYFDFDSSALRDDARPIIEEHARMLAANPALRLTVEGHADERGGREYNLSLGQKRAEAVLQALVLLGANESQLEAVSFGEERPAVQGSDEASWARNRRVELKQRR